MKEKVYRINLPQFLKIMTVIIIVILTTILLLTKFDLVMRLSLSEIVFVILKATAFFLPFYMLVSFVMYFIVRVKVTEKCVYGVNSFFLPNKIDWENVSKYKIENQLGFKYLKLYKQKGLLTVSVPLFLSNLEGFCEALETANPLGKEIATRIGKL